MLAFQEKTRNEGGRGGGKEYKETGLTESVRTEPHVGVHKVVLDCNTLIEGSVMLMVLHEL